MYTTFFNLAELPYRLPPDPRYLWYSDQHLEAKNKILYYITESMGPIYLVADVGTGKSLIARRIAQELSADPSKQVMYVQAAKLPTTNAFLRAVMDEFGIKTDRAYDRSLRNFEKYLIEQKEKGISPVLIIDEAQNMTRDMLLLIQHLFNFSTDTKFLIQIAMFSQPELRQKIKRLPSLESRLHVARLRPFDRKQTEEMLRFRWTVAGGSNFPFEDVALDEIYEVTNGNPRLIINLANEALMRAFALRKKAIPREAVSLAWTELVGEDTETI